MDNKLWMNCEAVQEDPELSAIFPSASHFPLWPHDQSEMWENNFYATPLMQEGELSMLLDGFNWDDMIMEASMPSEENMKIVQHNTKGERVTTNKRAREDRVLTFEEVSQYFYLPIIQAAKELNVGLTLLKKKCRELGIARWPHRKMKSMQTLIKNVQELRWKEGSVGDMQVKSAIEILEQEQKLMEMRPSVQMQKQTKRLRQACFKANYKKRKLVAVKEESW
ncbi:protein RKD1-like protein [Carex littledalei]|uniref:Protein RKD1-like protein n=1 Tax=Carex littledalei TaxID=544730 RepID=A0A833QKW0_9POAL|nr:protein RKD1-like protein [Carex littledalei]